MTAIHTHLSIDRALCGEPISVGAGTAEVVLSTSAVMAADSRGLVHGGFVFGAADYAAMLAVNDPKVVLGSAETRFVAPVSVGDAVRLTATQVAEKGKKRVIEVRGSVGETEVFTGTFTAFVLAAHVLD